jgi:hypothetical protein
MILALPNSKELSDYAIAPIRPTLGLGLKILALLHSKELSDYAIAPIRPTLGLGLKILALPGFKGQCRITLTLIRAT